MGDSCTSLFDSGNAVSTLCRYGCYHLRQNLPYLDIYKRKEAVAMNAEQ